MCVYHLFDCILWVYIHHIAVMLLQMTVGGNIKRPIQYSTGLSHENVSVALAKNKALSLGSTICYLQDGLKRQ